MNKTQIVYRGARPGVAKEFKGRRYTFMQGKAVYVPDEFAAILLKGGEFIRADDVEIPLVQRRPGGGRILIRRGGALGDLIILRAVAAAFQREHPTFRLGLRCQDRYYDVFRHDPTYLEVSGAKHKEDFEYDFTISLDQVPEADHRGDCRHRAELFRCAMDPKLELRVEDWDLPIPATTRKWVADWMTKRGLDRQRRSRPLIGVQLRGSHPIKSLPLETMKTLVTRLADIGDILIIEPSDRLVAPLLSDDRAHCMAGRDALHAVESMKYLDLVVCFDSSALWMAHCSRTPVLVMLGPTRPSERITMHPLYPSMARAICLNESYKWPDGKVGCEPCFEQQTRCRMKASCLQERKDYPAVVERIAAEVGAMLTGDVALPVVEMTNS